MPMELPDDWHLHVDDIIEHMLDLNIEQARRSKEALVANGPEDLDPMFAWYMDDGYVPIPIGKLSEATGLHPANVMEMLIPQLRRQLGGTPTLAVLGYEAWTRNLTPDDKVIPEDEAVVMIVATPRRALYVCMPFAYGDGSVVWGETVATKCETHELNQFGDMATALWSAFIPVEAN